MSFKKIAAASFISVYGVGRWPNRTRPTFGVVRRRQNVVNQRPEKEFRRRWPPTPSHPTNPNGSSFFKEYFYKQHQ